MTTKITYEFEATADNAQLLVDINSLIAKNALAIEAASLLAAEIEKPTPISEEDKAAILKALGEPGQPEPEQYYSEPVAPATEPEIDIPVLTAESVIPEITGPIVLDEPETQIADAADKFTELMSDRVEKATAPEPVKEIVDEPVAPAAALSETTEPEEDTPDISPHLAYNDVKEAARDAKKTHGDLFAKGVLTDHEVPVKTTLGRSIPGIPEEKYQSIVQAWVKGPVKSTSMFDVDPEPPTENTSVIEPEVTSEPAPEPETEPVDQPDIEPEAVKMALRAYARKHTKEAAKALMAEFDIPSLPAVSNADQATLTALFTRVL